MNKNKVIILLYLCLLVAACKPSGPGGKTIENLKNPVSLEGILQDGAHKDVILEEMAVREYIPIDTVSCDEEGHFFLRFEAQETAFYVLRTGGRGYITLLLEPGEQIILQGKYSQSDQYKVEGSRGSEALMELAKAHKRTIDDLGEIRDLMSESMEHQDYPQIKMGLDQKFDSVTSSFKNYSKDFISKNQESLSILIALYNLIRTGPSCI